MDDLETIQMSNSAEPVKIMSVCRTFSFAMNLLAMAVLTGALPARAQTAATTTYGEAITEDEIVQRTRLDWLSTRKPLAREAVVRELVDDKDAIKQSEKQGITSTDADVDRMYAAMTSHMGLTTERLTKSLESQGIHVETLKQRIKANIARRSLARMRYGERRDDFPAVPGK